MVGVEPAQAVAAWRRRLLRRAGYPAGMADALARDGRYDLHALVGLAARGCPPVLARRILAPLDDPPPPEEPPWPPPTAS
jgi:hypothetical protein